MYESGKDMPRHARYVYRYKHTFGGGSGQLSGFGKNSLENTGLVLIGGGGRVWRLTEFGRRFAEWLLKKERKCDFFWTPFGGWGEAAPGSDEEKWINEINNPPSPSSEA